jgi:hypothetical protein
MFHYGEIQGWTYISAPIEDPRWKEPSAIVLARDLFVEMGKKDAELARLRAALSERDTALHNANAIIGAQADENDRTVKGVLAKLAERDALLGEARLALFDATLSHGNIKCACFMCETYRKLNARLKSAGEEGA